MTVVIPGGYVLPGGSYPLTHARIIHARNLLSGGTVSASSTATDYYADGPNNSLTYEKWKPTSLTATWEYNHGSAATVDSCAIGAHTMGTNGNTAAVEYWNGSAWVEVARSAITDNSAIMFLFAPVSAQRWRISISSGTAPEVGVIRFARAMQMERPLYGGHAPIDMARQTTLRANYSETGEFLGRTKQRVMLATSFAWQNLTAAWVRANWRSFQLAAETEPFFIAWRPVEFGEVALCQVDAVPAPENMGIRDLMSVEMQVRAYGYD